MGYLEFSRTAEPGRRALEQGAAIHGRVTENSIARTFSALTTV
jgi:hypothetical protein